MHAFESIVRSLIRTLSARVPSRPNGSIRRIDCRRPRRSVITVISIPSSALLLLIFFFHYSLLWSTIKARKVEEAHQQSWLYSRTPLMTSNNKNADRSKTGLLHSTAGASSGAITRLISQPLDVIKIRFQLQVEPLSKKSNNSKYQSIYQSVCLISKEEGVKALWKGHIPAQFLSITYGLTQMITLCVTDKIIIPTKMAEIIASFISMFLVFQKSLAYFSVTEKGLNQTSGVHFLCGSSASTAATLTSYPFDVIRTRLVAQKSNQIYTNMKDVALSMYKTEGLSAYYRGIFPTVLQNSLQGGLIFMFYNTFSKFISTNTSTNNTFNDHYLNSVKQFSSGFMSGLVSKTLVYPLDVAKKRLQLQDFIQFREGFGKKFMCNGFSDCIRNTVKDETIFGLFKGLSPSLMKAGFVTALHLTFYEQIYKILCPLVNNY